MDLSLVNEFDSKGGIAGLVPAKKSPKDCGRYDLDAAERPRSVNEITKLSTRTTMCIDTHVTIVEPSSSL